MNNYGITFVVSLVLGLTQNQIDLWTWRFLVLALIVTMMYRECQEAADEKRRSRNEAPPTALPHVGRRL
jgi:hypothetical protein